jgi:H+-transporting ATPase
MPIVIQSIPEDSARLKPAVATDTPIRRGLSSADARRRLETLGSQHAVRRALGKLWAPVPWMLEAAILLQLFLGDYVEAGVATLLLVANAAIGFFQEGRAQATRACER